MGTAERGTPTAEVGHLTIYGPYVPAPPTDIAALYFIVVNEGDQADRLIKISSGVAGMAMLHQTVVDGDSSRMSPVEGGLEIPPGGEAVLAPGGYHVMLTNLAEPLEVGDVVHATLEFEDAGTVRIEAPVTDGTGGAMEGMSDDDDE
jgi:copper(I)-binding protein